MKTTILSTIAAGLAALAIGCGGDSSCIITNQGAEVCGESARAWCQVNENSRETAMEYAESANDERLKEDIRNTDDACAAVGG